MTEQAATSSTNGSGTQPSWSQQQSSPCGFDPQFLMKKIQSVLTDPKGCWTQIKSETITEKELICKFLLVMCAIPAVCQFIRMVVLGYSIPLHDVTSRMPFFSGLIYHIIYYASMVAMAYVGAIIIEMLAPKFEGKITRVDALKFMSYAFIPGYVAGIATLLPGSALQTLGALFSLYGLYIFFQGITPMTGVPQAKRAGFFGGFIICSIVAGIILFGVVGSIFHPGLQSPGLGKLNGNVNMQELGKEIDKFQKLLPSANK